MIKLNILLWMPIICCRLRQFPTMQHKVVIYIFSSEGDNHWSPISGDKANVNC